MRNPQADYTFSSWRNDMLVLFAIAAVVAAAFIPWVILVCDVLRPEVLT